MCRGITFDPPITLKAMPSMRLMAVLIDIHVTVLTSTVIYTAIFLCCLVLAHTKQASGSYYRALDPWRLKYRLNMTSASQWEFPATQLALHASRTGWLELAEARENWFNRVVVYMV